MKVIVTDVYYRMSLAAIRDLGEAGYDVRAIHYGAGVLPPPLKSRYLSGWERAQDLPGEERAEETLRAVDRIREPGETVVLLPVGARTTAALAASGLRDHAEIKMLLPTLEQLAAANDKASVLRLAGSLGISVPRAIEKPEEAEECLPVVIKYRNGEALGLKADERYRIVRTVKELYAVYSNMASRAILAGQDVPLIQQYIEGEGIGVSCLFDRDSRPVRILCHRRIREYPVTGGPSSCCETAWNAQLVGEAVRLLQAMRWQGIAMVEFRGNETDGYKLMEINPRIWGSFPLTRAAKSGFSAAYVRASLGEALPAYESGAEYPVPYQPGKKMQFVFQDLASGISHLRRGNGRQLSGAIRDLLNPTVRDGVIEFRDLRPSVEYIRTVFGKLARREED